MVSYTEHTSSLEEVKKYLSQFPWWEMLKPSMQYNLAYEYSDPKDLESLQTELKRPIHLITRSEDCECDVRGIATRDDLIRILEAYSNPCSPHSWFVDLIYIDGKQYGIRITHQFELIGG